jgi:SAM-dependent methyltransferase
MRASEQPPADQTAYWDRVAGEKDFTHPLDPDLLARFARGWRILDLGCGYGRLTAALVDAGYSGALGADLSAEMIRRGRAARPDLDLRVLAPGPLAFGDAAFDAALLFSVLTCLPRRGDLEALLAELARVVRPGGLLWASDLGLQDDDVHRARYAAGRARYGELGVFDHPEGVAFCHLSPERLALLERAFPRLEHREREVRTMNGRRVRAFSYLGRRPERV